MEGLIRITPDREKARSILKMANITLNMIDTIDLSRFSSNVTKQYYDVIRELVSIIVLLDGYKTYREGAHKILIDYLKSNYNQFKEFEISLIDDLRIKRNRISYDGFFVDERYIKKRKEEIKNIIDKLKEIINKKLC